MPSTSSEPIVKDQLQRNVSGFSAYAMVIGSIIGTGIFFSPQAIFKATGTASLGLLAWMIGCLLGLCGGLIIAEIGAMIPETGGLMTYIEKIYNKPLGFLVGWAQATVFYPIRVAAICLVFGTQFVSLFALKQGWLIPVSILVVLYVFLINYLGNRTANWAIDIATLLKFIPIITIILFGFFHNKQPATIHVFPVTIETHPFWQGLSISVISSLYATDGWINITNIAGEIKNPQKNIPRALVGGLLTVSAVYLLINLAYLRVLSPAQMAESNTVAADVAGVLLGQTGQRIVAVGILISTLGSAISFANSSWRIPYALGLRKLLPFSEWFSKLHPRTGVPVNGGLAETLLSVLGILFIHDFNTLSDIGSYIIWIFYTLAFIGIFILRIRWKLLKRSYKVPLYPFIPIIGIIGGLFIVISTTIYQPKIACYNLLLIALGLPLYFFCERRKNRE